MGHGYHSTGEIVLGVIGAGILWWFMFAVIRAFEGKKPEEIQPDLVAESLRVVSTPMQLPGGRWGVYKTELVECAAPMAPNDTEPHFPTDKNHRAVCKRCQQEYARCAR